MTHCPGCKGTVEVKGNFGNREIALGDDPCPGVACPACQEKEAEIDRLKTNYETTLQAMAIVEAENQHLRALVAVGREMADDAIDHSRGSEFRCRLCGEYRETQKSLRHIPECPIAKWSSLEGKR